MLISLTGSASHIQLGRELFLAIAGLFTTGSLLELFKEASWRKGSLVPISRESALFHSFWLRLM
jgi:hypothetical protein